MKYKYLIISILAICLTLSLRESPLQRADEAIPYNNSRLLRPDVPIGARNDTSRFFHTFSLPTDFYKYTLSPKSPFETPDIADKRQIITSVLDTIGEPILAQAAAKGKLDFLLDDPGVRELEDTTDRVIQWIKEGDTYKGLQQDPAIAFHIVNFARAILDREDFKGKEIVVVGRAADLIYDALVGLANIMPEYRDRREDIVLFDYSTHANAFWHTHIHYKNQLARYVEEKNRLDKEKGVVIVDELGIAYDEANYPLALKKLLVKHQGWDREKIKIALMEIKRRGRISDPDYRGIDFVYTDTLDNVNISTSYNVSYWLAENYDSGREYDGVDLDETGYPVRVNYEYCENYHLRRFMLKCRIYREIMEKTTVEGLLALGDWYLEQDINTAKRYYEKAYLAYKEEVKKAAAERKAKGRRGPRRELRNRFITLRKQGYIHEPRW